MAKEINLISTKETISGSILKIASQIKVFDTLGTIIFFIGVFVLTAVMIINSQELKSSNARQEKLKTSIKSMQKVEQQYVLVKDRVDKIEKILADRAVMKGVESFNTLKLNLPGDVIYGQITITKSSTETSFSVSNYSSLAQTLANLVSPGLYKEVILNSFSFSPKTGYLISVKLSP